MMVSFFVPGEPVAQGRPRVSTISGHPRMHDAPKSAQYKNLVAMVAIGKMLDKPIMERPVDISITVHKPIPTSWSKKKQALAMEGLLKPTGKPDIDNYIKAIFDGCNAIVFKDDCQVTHVTARKMYSATPGVFVVAIEEEL